MGSEPLFDGEACSSGLFRDLKHHWAACALRLLDLAGLLLGRFVLVGILGLKLCEEALFDVAEM